MNKPICKDVNRACEYGEVKTSEEIKPETVRVVDRTMGYDDISHEEKTGNFIKVTQKYKVCKYCGHKEIISTNRKTVRQVYV